uniref:Glycoprotein n=1 Tax=Strongyloides papillosus TaxID=174720 RepID=A0A0N5BXV7_STREA
MRLTPWIQAKEVVKINNDTIQAGEVVNFNNDNIQEENTSVVDVLPDHLKKAMFNSLYLWLKDIVAIAAVILFVLFIIRYCRRSEKIRKVFKFFFTDKRKAKHNVHEKLRNRDIEENQVSTNEQMR